MTVPVRVSYCGRESLICAMVDTGPQRTFCDTSLGKGFKAMDPGVLLPCAPCHKTEIGHNRLRGDSSDRYSNCGETIN